MKLEVPLVLVLDSGGGACPHLSTEFVQAALQYNIYPFYLPAYTTKCFCALDQSVRAEMSAKWKAFKQRYWRPEHTDQLVRGIARGTFPQRARAV